MLKNKLCVAGTTARFPLLIFILAVMVPFLSGCGATDYGRLQSSREITEVFKNSRVFSDHQYYFSGFQRVPYGIIGIDKNYTLRSSLWKPIDMNPTILNQLTYRMEAVYSIDPRGAWILDHNGNRLGIWYSSQKSTKVRLEKDDQIVVVTPSAPDLSSNPR